MNTSQMTPWRGLIRAVCLGLLAALAGAGGLGEGFGARAAWAQEELFVANRNNNSITVYARTANGNTAPLRTLAGDSTGLAQPVGIFVDTVHNELVVANLNGSITVYARTASGNTAPLRPLATGLQALAGIVVDTVHDELVVAGCCINQITVYARTASGNTDPLRTLAGDRTGLNLPSGVAVDTVHDELVVVNFNSASITVYPRTASGNTRRLRTLAGDSTGLNGPMGIVVDTVHDELVVVANFDSISVFAGTAGGNTAPLRTLVGGSTGLSGPAAIAVTAVTTGPVTCPRTFAFDFSGTQYADCFRAVQRGEQIAAELDVGGTNHDSLVFTGSAGSGGGTWLTVYDNTPTTPAPAPTFGTQTLCADVLVHRFNNRKGAGVVALLNEGEGKGGLGLIVSDAGNTDILRLATVDGDPTKKGKLHTLTSVSLKGGIALNTWYRLVMTVDPEPPPGRPKVTGRVFKHTDPTDPGSDLGAQVGSTLEFQDPLPQGVSSPGQSGIIAQAVSAVVDLSVTNFTNDERCARRPE